MTKYGELPIGKDLRCRKKMFNLTFLATTSHVIVLRFGHFCSTDIRLSLYLPPKILPLSVFFFFFGLDGLMNISPC